MTAITAHDCLLPAFHCHIQEGYTEDVYDSPVYTRLKDWLREKDPDGVPIFLQICWDGATMFNFVKGPSMWPLCYSIMNLPPSLRNKVNVGLHVASFCDGAEASQIVLADELMQLIVRPIEVDGIKYYVMVAQALFDGPGRTKYMKLLSTNSLEGCPLCDVDARTWGNRRVYDSWRRYLPQRDDFRKKIHKKHVVKTGPHNPSIHLQYAFAEGRPPPVNR